MTGSFHRRDILLQILAGCFLLFVPVPCKSAVVATGGNATNDIGDFRIHVFTNSATASNFVVTVAGNVDVLIVAGGGGGGGLRAGSGCRIRPVKLI